MTGLARLLVAAGLLSAAAAQAAEIKVLTAGAYKPVIDEVASAFQDRSGNTVTVVTDTAAGVAARIARGEAFDLAVLTPATAKDLEFNKQLILVTPVASVGIGVAVKQGAPKPDISTPAALKQALLAARAIAMVDPASGGTSGIYLAKMLDQMGIADQVKSKLVLTPGGLAAERVASGQADVALGQISELLAVPGVTLAGPLPAELQQRTVYVAGMNPQAAQAPLILLAALAGPDAQAVLKEKGMQPP